MTSRGLTLFLIGALLSLAALPVIACTPEEEDAKKFTPWNYAVSAADGQTISGIAYEVRRTGFHTADVHFKNFTKDPANVSFWLPGYQTPHDNPVSRIASSYPLDTETVVPITLQNGANGVNFAALKVSASPSAGPNATTLAPVNSGGDAWLPIAPLRASQHLTSESVSCCVRKSEVRFRNNSRTALFFDFIIPGYQSAGEFNAVRNPRVSLAIGQECAIPIALDHPDAQLPLARVRSFNVRTDSDSGEFLDATELDDGWFRVTCLNCPTVNPNQLVYRIEDLDDARIKLHFKNISRLSVTFEFGLGDAMTGSLNIPADSQSNVVMALPRASAQRALARVKVTHIVYLAAR